MRCSGIGGITIMADITTVRVVVNMTNGPVYVANGENQGDNMTVLPNDLQVSHFNGTAMFIPWCRDYNEWNEKHYISLIVNTSAIIYNVWQFGNTIWYCADAQLTSGRPVPGYSNILGERIFVIDDNFALNVVQLS
jgi:hypothetical protein